MGLADFQAREIAFALGLPPALIRQAVETIGGCYRAFRDLDATLVEINPLAVTRDGLLALDAKMAFDDSALFRRPEIAELRDKSQEDPREARAADRSLRYLGLEGAIAVVANGSGLGLATLELIRALGAAPRRVGGRWRAVGCR